MQYLVIHNNSQILLATPYNGDAAATNHTVVIDTFENLVTQLEALSIDVTVLIDAVNNYEESKNVG